MNAIFAQKGITISREKVGPFFSLTVEYSGFSALEVEKVQWNFDRDSISGSCVECATHWPNQKLAQNPIFKNQYDGIIQEKNGTTFGKRIYMLGDYVTYTAYALLKNGEVYSSVYVTKPEDISPLGNGPFLIYGQWTSTSTDTMFCNHYTEVLPVTALNYNGQFQYHKFYIDGKEYSVGNNKKLDPGKHVVKTELQIDGIVYSYIDTVFIYEYQYNLQVAFKDTVYFNGFEEFQAIECRVTNSIPRHPYHFSWEFTDEKDEYWEFNKSYTPNIGPGKYYIIVSDLYGCKIDTTVVFNLLPSVIYEQPQLKVDLFPNPATDQITITGEYTSGAIYDLSGREVLVFGTAQQLNVSSLPAGNYVARVTDRDGGVGVSKFVKIE